MKMKTKAKDKVSENESQETWWSSWSSWGVAG